MLGDVETLPAAFMREYDSDSDRESNDIVDQALDKLAGAAAGLAGRAVTRVVRLAQQVHQTPNLLAAIDEMEEAEYGRTGSAPATGQSKGLVDIANPTTYANAGSASRVRKK